MRGTLDIHLNHAWPLLNLIIKLERKLSESADNEARKLLGAGKLRASIGVYIG
jgi:hypothetical protein